MGQLKSMDLREPGSHSATDASPAKPSKSLWWLWVVVIAGIVVGIWYFRGSRITSEAATLLYPQRQAEAAVAPAEWAILSCPSWLPPRSVAIFLSTSTDWEP